MNHAVPAPTLSIGGRTIGAGHAPFVIAEIGVNHDGDLARACELVHAARRAGADAAKFQMFDAAMLMSRDSVLAAYQRERGARDPRELLQGLQLPPEALGELAEECARIGIVPIVTVFSLPLVEIARAQPWQAFKTASPDLVNLPLLRATLAHPGFIGEKYETGIISRHPELTDARASTPDMALAAE
jgi:N-acetylneuraminate synthase/N,N'-diacetyllegionaminate synthase